MKIRFKEPIQWEITTGYDFDANPVIETAVFWKGEVVGVLSIEINENFGTAMIQFDDGTVAYGVPMAYFEVVEL